MALAPLLRRAPPVVAVRSLTARFGPLIALEDVEFEIAPGEVVAVAGENGAGKTTLVRCIAGDLVPSSGEVRCFGRSMSGGPQAAAAAGVAVVWQDLALCDNLDVAANLLLGREPKFLLGSGVRLHDRATEILERLHIPLADTSQVVASLSGGQRQLLAVARAMRDQPRLLVLDEPTSSLGVNEAAAVERLIIDLREEGVTILLVSHDIELLLRLADRIVVLRGGQLVGDVDPSAAHPDDVVALMSGQELDSSPRGQLTRLHGLVERLASSERDSVLPLILSTLADALRVQQCAIHVLDGTRLRCVASIGLSSAFLAAWSDIEVGARGGSLGLAQARGTPSFDEGLGATSGAIGTRERVEIAGVWAVPITGADGVVGVMSVLRPHAGGPERDELDLVTLYASYAASALERDRLFNEVTLRNSVLETIRGVLETLAGAYPVHEAIDAALRALREGLRVEEVALVIQSADGRLVPRAVFGEQAAVSEQLSPVMAKVAIDFLADPELDGRVQRNRDASGGRFVGVSFNAPGGHAVLFARAAGRAASSHEHDLMADASHSFRLALERQEMSLVSQEAEALRRSRELQRDFLSRLSHELRTPLTAIRGYASSLMQEDVTWDRDSEVRFLSRMASESARLGRLVGDLLDYSAIESGVMRLQRDWCDLPLILEAAAELLAPENARHVEMHCDADLPVVWADHDRLEQVFVNLLDNAFRHNPPGVSVVVRADLDGTDAVRFTVHDDGPGIPPAVAASLFEPGRRWASPSAGTGLGLSIAKAIVDAHGGRIELEPSGAGTTFVIYLPIEVRGADETGEPGSDGGGAR